MVTVRKNCLVVLLVTEIRESNRQDFIGIVQEAKQWSDIAAILLILFLQVPFALVAPTCANGAIGNNNFLTVGIKDNRFPV